MEETVVVVDADEDQCHRLCAVLERCDYPAVPLHSLPDLQEFLFRRSKAVVIMDIDTIRIDNHTIQNFALKNPGVYLLCLSCDRFHPDRIDKVCYYIYACIAKPFENEEIFFWLSIIYQDELAD